MMGIYLPGMEMPTGCISCDFCNPFVEEPYCRRLMKRVPKVTRLDNCPLTEAPEPHGRLIDADALKYKWAHKDLDLFSQGWGWLRDLNQASTIIPASGKDTDVPTREEDE